MTLCVTANEGDSRNRALDGLLSRCREVQAMIEVVRDGLKYELTFTAELIRFTGCEDAPSGFGFCLVSVPIHFGSVPDPSSGPISCRKKRSNKRSRSILRSISNF